ncbi:hypothetical protein BD779DRAFT_1536857 [Infundibulicybe gibba]|nr:hypothetical protein BD779DRAFT_1536857 [Infundibulicybe gibba]
MLAALSSWFGGLGEWPKLATHLLLGSQIPFTPLSCFEDPASKTLADLITCFESFTVPTEYYDDTRYATAQPTPEERTAWSQLVSTLLTSGRDCEDVTVPAVLRKVYTITRFTEPSRLSYCVLSESNSIGAGQYVRGWGVLVVPAMHSYVSRDLHISAPHPGSDVGTARQAAHLFRATGARSLLIPGRSRRAFMTSTECVKKIGEESYYKTDPAHDNTEPFFDASKAIREWQNENDGCPSAVCAFIQLHGKGRSTCPDDHMFLSSGLGHGDASIKWYTDDTDRPIKRLQRQLLDAFPNWQISLPSDSDCSLTATQNVVGRFINGVDEAQVCDEAARVANVNGEFIHIEQAPVARTDHYYDAWTLALRSTFASSWDPDVAEE